MRLRKECEHGQYDPHRDEDHDLCPGAEFLPDTFEVQLSTDEDVESLDLQYWHQDLTDFIWAKGGWAWFVLVPKDAPPDKP